MEIMSEVAAAQGLAVLFHEKPFAGVNGSGKHSNWGLNTDSGKNLFKPGKSEESQVDFIASVAALAHALNNHGDLLRCGVACAGNDHRLGAQEAPPAIVSLDTATVQRKSNFRSEPTRWKMFPHQQRTATAPRHSPSVATGLSSVPWDLVKTLPCRSLCQHSCRR